MAFSSGFTMLAASRNWTFSTGPTPFLTLQGSMPMRRWRAPCPVSDSFLTRRSRLLCHQLVISETGRSKEGLLTCEPMQLPSQIGFCGKATGYLIPAWTGP